MPSMHRYRCLQSDCTGSGRRDCTGLFAAMNSPLPSCPSCGSLKVQDWGESTDREGWISTNPASFGHSGAAKQSDQNLRRIADRYDLTNISNKDGKPAKQAPMPPPNNFGPMTNIGGYQVPLSAASSGACTNLPMTVPLKTQVGAPKTKTSGMMSQMTRVVASDKARA